MFEGPFGASPPSLLRADYAVDSTSGYPYENVYVTSPLERNLIRKSRLSHGLDISGRDTERKTISLLKVERAVAS